jgi:hypothetical protein
MRVARKVDEEGTERTHAFVSIDGALGRERTIKSVTKKTSSMTRADTSAPLIAQFAKRSGVNHFARSAMHSATFRAMPFGIENRSGP